MQSKISRSAADYLKAIYSQTCDQNTTSTNELAERLNVAPSSVTSMLKKLSKKDPPLVDYQKSYGVSLTNTGEKAALQIIRRHRLLETFLVKIMGYSWEDVHREAEELEHVISQRFEDSMDQLLGHPEFDPHGDPIPDMNLQIPNANTISLSQLSIGQSATIRRVYSSHLELLQHLNGLGVQPGAEITIQSRNPFDQTIQFTIGDSGERKALGVDISDQIYVEV